MIHLSLLILILSVFYGNLTPDRAPLDVYPGTIHTDKYLGKWILWLNFYNKTYQPNNKSRMKIWIYNFVQNNAHNQRFEDGQQLYQKGTNSFSDLAPKELQKLVQREVPLGPIYGKHLATKLLTRPVKSSVNWALENVAPPVRDEVYYHKGWLVSALGAVQSQFAKVKGEHLSLSMKEIIDCSFYPGRPLISLDAFSYIFKLGIALERAYPLTDTKRETCQRHDRHPKRFIKGYRLTNPGDEDSLKMVVAKVGPVSANIWVTNNFFFYKSGIFYDPHCGAAEKVTNHAVLVVGYGTDPLGGGDYWIIQNNWGRTWGEKGFARMARNSVVNCGIASAAFYPVI